MSFHSKREAVDSILMEVKHQFLEQLPPSIPYRTRRDYLNKLNKACCQVSAMNPNRFDCQR